MTDTFEQHARGYNWPPATDLEMALYLGDVVCVLLSSGPDPNPDPYTPDPDTLGAFARDAAHWYNVACETGQINETVN